MAILSFEALTAPLPGAEPCGTDLELADDADYMNFMAAADWLLPQTFYYPSDGGDPALRGKPFDRTTVDFASQYKIIARLGERTHDLRLVVLLAKFSILDRDVSGFARAVEAVAVLLEQYWDAVHPRGDIGDFGFRRDGIQSLDDMVPVILPLQYAPLFEHRNAGQVSYRNLLVAEGEAEPRGDETKLDPAVFARAFDNDANLATLVERRDQFKAIGAALARIKATFIDRLGLGKGVDFPRLAPLVEKIRAMLEAQVILRDPSAGEPPVADESVEAAAGQAEGRPGDIASFTDARAALGAIAAYYERCEPSSPALLLVRQAEQLVGKSFLEALRVLVPGYVDDVKVQIGRTQVFDLPLGRLSEFASIENPREDGAAGEATFTVTTRDTALQLLAKVGAFYHAAEPSSPVPCLIERARNCVGKDFLGLLREMLPRDTLKTLEGK